jgi:hypothetical protein
LLSRRAERRPSGARASIDDRKVAIGDPERFVRCGELDAIVDRELPIGFPIDADAGKAICCRLTASGRFTIVPDSKSADLTVLSKIDSDIPGYEAPPSSHQILLEFNKQSGGSVFWVTLHLSGVSDQWAQSPVVNTCLANLWKRVESLRSPSASRDE